VEERGMNIKQVERWGGGKKKNMKRVEYDQLGRKIYYIFFFLFRPFMFRPYGFYICIYIYIFSAIFFVLLYYWDTWFCVINFFAPFLHLVGYCPMATQQRPRRNNGWNLYIRELLLAAASRIGRFFFLFYFFLSKRCGGLRKISFSLFYLIPPFTRERTLKVVFFLFFF
jgi:hypothetical protein